MEKHTITCPKCKQEAELDLSNEEINHEVSFHCDNCGDTQFASYEVPKELLFLMIKKVIAGTRDHQNHTIAGKMARQHYITTHGCEFSTEQYDQLIKYGDGMCEAAETLDEDDVNPIAVLTTLFAYQEDLDTLRGYHMAVCQAIATLKLVEVPESCKQDFCEGEK